MPDPVVVSGGSAAWNPQRGCWEFVDIYWEAEFSLDDEWIDEDCFLRRTEQVIWRDVTCKVRNEDGSWTELSRHRESVQSYFLVEHWCKNEKKNAWTKPAPQDHPRRQEWDADDEFWRTVR
jgi:hypothetical protein